MWIVLVGQGGRAKRILETNCGEPRLKTGYLYLQAESHPLEFRKVELLVLDPR